MSDEIGNLIVRPGEMRIEWRLLNFFSLPPEVDKEFFSPVFFFAGLAWRFGLYPNGQSSNQTEGFVGFYLYRKCRGPPKTVSYSISLRKANGEMEIVLTSTTDTFIGADAFPVAEALNSRSGRKKFLVKSNLIKRKDQLVPDDTLTVICNLTTADGHSLDASFITRLWNLSLNLATVMSTREEADVTLELPDGELNAHEMILKARSSVFDRMFSHDLKESQTGEVKIEEGDKKSYEVVLAYIYTGDPCGLSPENVKDVYKISHKYDLRDLTKCCGEFMLQVDLSVNTICDVITIAILYQDKKLLDGAKDYFVTHKKEIVKTDHWKALKEENLKIVCEILEYALNKE